MLTKPDSEYSQKEILGLIMLPGFFHQYRGN